MLHHDPFGELRDMVTDIDGILHRFIKMIPLDDFKGGFLIMEKTIDAFAIKIIVYAFNGMNINAHLLDTGAVLFEIRQCIKEIYQLFNGMIQIAGHFHSAFP